RIVEIKDLENLISLERINLSKNVITEMKGEDISNLRNLKFFQISNNPVSISKDMNLYNRRAVERFLSKNGTIIPTNSVDSNRTNIIEKENCPFCGNNLPHELKTEKKDSFICENCGSEIKI
ncbi:MAG: hypothetical protein GY870_09040, partial [archaeon]|nr:hypothetical protein [archaeon]